jgi:hypothetical protein
MTGHAELARRGRSRSGHCWQANSDRYHATRVPHETPRRCTRGLRLSRAWPHGKRVYEQHAELADRAAKNRFEELVLGALREAHPELFDGGGA